MIVLDASVLIAHLSADDDHHLKATRILEENAGEDITIHPITMAEVLVDPARAGRVQQTLELLDGMKIEEWFSPPGESVRLAQLRANTGLKMPDCCSLAIAIEGRASLATFDTRLASAARGLGVTVVEPV